MVKTILIHEPLLEKHRELSTHRTLISFEKFFGMVTDVPLHHSSAIIHKKIGETPLQAIERFRNDQHLDADLPLAYAGRLDPMASGLLLVLIGEECKKQTQYHHLDKKYEFEVLFGIESDTSDVLGMVTENLSDKKITQKELNEGARALRGNITLPYPLFSSKTVAGKPLFLWKLENRMHEITIPTKASTIYHLDCEEVYTLSKNELRDLVFAKINSFEPVTDESKKLGADFRRDDIRAQWEKLFETTHRQEFFVARFSCICSSGTYMRTLAKILAEEIGTTGLALSIHRTTIGTYRKLGPIGFWIKKYR